MSRYETFGWIRGDMDAIAEHVQQALDIRLQPRDSLYRGEYFAWRRGGAHLILQRNFLEDDGLPTDSKYPGHLLLLYASELPDEWFDRLAVLPGAERLESTILP